MSIHHKPRVRTPNTFVFAYAKKLLSIKSSSIVTFLNDTAGFYYRLKVQLAHLY